MIKKDIIKNSGIRLFSWMLVTVFLFLTISDIYIKNYGNVSENKPTEEFIREAEAAGYIYSKSENTIRLMTYNLLADSIGFDGIDVKYRAGGVCTVVEKLNSDVICFQEMSRKWFATVKNNTDYKFINFFRTMLFGSMTTLAYNNKKLDLLFSGEKTFSNGGDSRLRRMVWAIFSCKNNGGIFAVVNVHFDLVKKADDYENNSLQLSQMLETTSFIKEIQVQLKCPVFIMGDFNVKESTDEKVSAVYEILNSYFYDAKNKTSVISEGNSPQTVTSKNDHVFFLGDVYIEQYCVLSNESFKALSDHFPLFVDVRLKTETKVK